jgi:DNA-binding NtrC family response regulator
VFPIMVPALAARAEDIPELARHFIARFAAEEGKRIARISAQAVTLLASYGWPGNVRQLENAVFRAVVLAESDEVGVNEFPQIAAQLARESSETGSEGAPVQPPGVDALPVVAAEPAAAAAGDLGPRTAPASSLALIDATGEVRPLEELETEVIRFAVTHYRGQMSEVARRLRIGRSTLYRKLDLLGFGADAQSADSRTEPSDIAAAL